MPGCRLETRLLKRMRRRERRDRKAALGQFRALLEVDANYANAFFMGAQALQHAERMDEAAQWLRDGIECAKRVGNRHAESEMQALLDELES